ncbi:NAD(P)H dehydrogenase (quinone) [Erythrobacter sp. Dej080120_24]|uniref:NAD(P)H-dependent oxidoreductase n=1 Tax=unclassified Erythrobacter TaxID=2633097 RepID=UPI002922535B|nr:NAD(P)H dehydrogenase (quinone) [Erythrobacter sp. Dej080120_24]
MSERVFVWVAHPRAGSFSAALADAYQQAAQAAGAEVGRMDLSEMEFSSEFRGYGDAPALEPSLQQWQANLAWADRVLIVHPLWWGAMPTLAKSVLDRALTPGFAYKYKARGMAWDKLLDGKTGDAIITADTPTWVDTWLYNKPARRTIKQAVYQFCGIRPRFIRQLGSVKMSDAAARDKWLGLATQMRAKAAA